MSAAPAAPAAEAAPLEPPPTPQEGPRTGGGRLRPTIYLGAAVGLFALMWLLSQTWTAGDEAVAGWVAEHLSGTQRATWRALSWPGATLLGLALVGAGAVGCAFVREWRAAVVAGGTAFFAAGAVQTLKQLVARDRPDDAVLDTYAFPSGHSTTAMVDWGLLALVVLPALARHVHFTPLSRRLAIGLWIAIAAFTGATRVLGGVHWTSDVVAGWSFGGALLVLAVRAARTDRPPPRMDQG